MKSARNIAILVLLLLLWGAPAGLFAVAGSLPSDTLSDYSRYPYIQFVGASGKPELTDEEFYKLAGRVIFPVNKYATPKNDSLLIQLEREVLPMISRDSLELVSMMIRGAASPEGPTRWNDFLGHERAKVLIRFVSDCLNFPIDEENFDLQIDIEDYRTLCIVMRQANDADYPFVQYLCNKYLPGDMAQLKAELQKWKGGQLWRHLLRDYFPGLRAARVVFFFRAPRTHLRRMQNIAPFQQYVPFELTVRFPSWRLESPLKKVVVPRRELLSVKSNLLFDFAYVPGYDRWCPIPNVAIEFYPLRGHFTFGASFDCPWWQHYDDHKYFQIRNYQLESRYYFRSGSIDKNPLGEGAAFRGLYVQAYVHAGIYGICFDENRGWVGEALGGGVGAGYVLPLTKKGHWRLEFAAQVGYLFSGYDPYQYENPVNPNYRDHLYYYKWTGKPEQFKERQYRFTWLGPTRVGITLSYDLLYRRNLKKGVSVIPWENVPN